MTPVPLSQTRRREILALHRKKERRKRGRLLVEGPVGVRALLHVQATAAAATAGHMPRIRAWYAVVAREAAAEDAAVAEVVTRLHAAGVEVATVDAVEFAELAATHAPQGVLAVVVVAAPPPLREWLRADAAEAAAAVLPRNRCRLLILDGVQDPGNVGTLLRSAAAFGVGGVALTVGCADASNPKVVRASMGGFAALPVFSGIEPAEVAQAVGEAGLPLWLAEVGGKPYRELARPTACAVALGAEVAGLSQALRAWEAEATASAAADRVTRVGIPLAAEPQSLNVAMAGTVLLAHLAP